MKMGEIFRDHQRKNSHARTGGWVHSKAHLSSVKSLLYLLTYTNHSFFMYDCYV